MPERVETAGAGQVVTRRPNYRFGQQRSTSPAELRHTLVI